jgi:hypothetical protein
MNLPAAPKLFPKLDSAAVILSQDQKNSNSLETGRKGCALFGSRRHATGGDKKGDTGTRIRFRVIR